MSQPSAKPTLAENLAKAAAIKAEMARLLSELEQAASGHRIEKPGGWRHHPKAWAEENLT